MAFFGCLVALTAARPQFLLGGGNGAGFGTGHAGPFGTSGTGVALSNAQNGGFSASTGQGAGSNTIFGQQATGTGNTVSGGGRPVAPVIAGPVRPVSPVGPVRPVGPVGPVRPVSPVGPVGVRPVAPVGGPIVGPGFGCKSYRDT